MATPRPRTPREAFAAARTPGTVVAGSAAGLDGVTDLAGVPAGWTSGAAAGGNDGDGRVAWLAWVAWLAFGGVGTAALEGAGTAAFLAGAGAVVLAVGGVLAAGVGAAGVGAGPGGVVAGGVAVACHCSNPTVTQMPVPSLLGTTPTPMVVHLGSTMFS